MSSLSEARFRDFLKIIPRAAWKLIKKLAIALHRFYNGNVYEGEIAIHLLMYSFIVTVSGFVIVLLAPVFYPFPYFVKLALIIIYIAWLFFHTLWLIYLAWKEGK